MPGFPTNSNKGSVQCGVVAAQDITATNIAAQDITATNIAASQCGAGETWRRM
jgi:hypothetical protein